MKENVVEQTNITVGTGSTAAAAWAQGKSDWAYFMGEDVVAEAVAVPEEIRGKLPGDYKAVVPCCRKAA